MNPVNSLVDRARTAMNLLLLATLVAAWAVAAGGITERLEERKEKLGDIVDDAADLRRLYRSRFPEQASLLEAVKRSEALGHEEVDESALTTLQRDMVEERAEFSSWAIQISRAIRNALDEGAVNVTLEDLRAIDSILDPPATKDLSDEAKEALDRLNMSERVFAVESEMSASAEATAVATGRVRDLIQEFEADYEKADVESNASIAEMVVRLDPDVTIPALGLDFPASRAVTLIGAGAVALLLYLLSIAFTICDVAGDAQPSEGVDWVFFHRSLFGFWLGAAWLLLPGAVVLFHIYKAAEAPNGEGTVVLHASLLICLLVVGVMVCRQLRRARRILSSRRPIRMQKGQQRRGRRLYSGGGRRRRRILLALK